MTTATAAPTGLPTQGVDLNKMQVDLAVLSERTGNMDKSVSAILANQEKALATYATKEELKAVKDGLDGVRAWLGWGVKTVLGVVIIALVSLVVAKGGVPHP